MTSRPIHQSLSKILLTGDVMLGRLVDQFFPDTHCADEEHEHVVQYFSKQRPELMERYRLQGYAFPWGNTLPYFQNATIRLINLETSATTYAIKYPDKEFNYRMHPRNLEGSLRAAQVDYASLANNHILDYCVPGMQETIHSLDQLGVKHAGAGMDLKSASQPALVPLVPSSCLSTSVSDTALLIYSMADHYSFWASDDHKPGIFFVDLSSSKAKSSNQRKEIINKLKTEIEFYRSSQQQQQQQQQPTSTQFKNLIAVVSIHMGSNYAWQPTNIETEFCHDLIDIAGVDLIHGHSSHHIKGVEIYKGKPILYGCGDFVDDYAVDREYRNDLGFLYQLIYNHDTKTFSDLELVPTEIHEFQVNIAPPGTNRDWLFRTMTSLCKKLGTSVEKETDSLHIRIA